MNVISRNYQQFFQKKENERTLGSYYTDPEHCRWLGNLFRFSEDEQTAVLEPSAGNGVAVKLVTKADRNPMVRIFADEINNTAADLLEGDNCFECVLRADFKSEVFISNNAFTFCFGNPPYMKELDFDGTAGIKAERLEKVFLDKVTKYLKKGGIICWVIPYRVFMENPYTTFWMSRYETLGIFRFHDSEFAKWGQIACIGRKRAFPVGIFKDDRVAYQETFAMENLPLVPVDVPEEKKIEVPTSMAREVTDFRKLQFDGEVAEKWVEEHPECLSPLNQVIRMKTGMEKYDDACLYTPPKKLGSQNLALLTACGIGSGFAGSVEGRDLHLQRGSVTLTESRSIRKKNTGDGDSEVLVCKTQAQTNIVLIESDGKITDLIKKKGE